MLDTEKQMNLYGCLSEELDEMIADELMPLMGGPYMLAMSILSDAQERIAIGHGDIARQYINRAKYVILRWNDTNQGED